MPDPRVHVDFNGVEEDGCIAALRSHADTPGALAPGTIVMLFDGDGNSALGRVAEIGERDLVWITVLWDSWSPQDPGLDSSAEQPAYFTMAPGTARRAVWSFRVASRDIHDGQRCGRHGGLSYRPVIHFVNTDEPATSGR